jgi:signal transduction histidine kinase/ligand-binding sensor domain-containing protein
MVAFVIAKNKLSRRLHIGILSLLFLLNANIVIAQAADQVAKYTTANGLSINSVNDLLFDTQGFLWVSTSDGLQRFDGYHFITYKNIPKDSTSIPSNLCFSLWQDANENLWVAFSNTICVKEKNSIQFQKIKGQLTFQDYKIFAEDNHYIWVSTYDSIILINKKTFTVKQKFGLKDDVLASELLVIAKSNSTQSKVAIEKYLLNNKTPFTLGNLLFNVSYFINAKNKQLYELNINSSNFLENVTSVNNNALIKPTDVILLANQISNSEFLLTVKNKGAFFYNRFTKAIVAYSNNELLLQNIDFTLLRTVAIDKYSSVWLGHSGQRGMTCIKNNNQPFKNFIATKNNTIIYGMQHDGKDNLFVSFYNQYVHIYGKNGQLKNKISKYNVNTYIRAMKMVDSQNMLLINTGCKAFLYDINGGKLDNISTNLSMPAYSGNANFDKHILEYKNGFVFNISDELIQLTMVNGKPKVENIFQLKAKNAISAFYPLNDNAWIIGTTEGLYRCSNNTNILVEGVPLAHIKYITADKQNKIWVATAAGLYVLKNGKLFKTFNEKNGLLSEFVYGVLFDKVGNAWCSSNKGLVRIDTAYNIKLFNQTNGLLSDEYNTNGFLAHPNGNFYFAGLGGIDYFNPNTFEDDTVSTQVQLSEMKVNYETFKNYKNDDNEIYITLPFNKNNLSLSFAVMDFFDVKNNQFKYYLKGIQPQWSIPTTNNEVNYILPPGEYTLQVHGKNHYGLWTKKPLLIHINILPAWYQTIWFKVALMLAALLLIGSLFYFYNKRKFNKKIEQLKMQQQIQFEKERLSRDLHDNLGSQLALLSNNVAHLDTSNKKHNEVTDDIDRLKNTSKQLLQTLRETLWILDKEEISTEDFFDKIVEYTSRYLQSFPNIKLEIEEKFVDAKMINANNALQLFRICQEAINNACKYSNSKILKLKGDGTSNNVQITIADFGCGFDKGNLKTENHYGLKNMEQRAVSIGANIEIESKLNEGTSVVINIKT